MDKPIIFVDSNFVTNIFGENTYDYNTGIQALTELSEKYDIRLTSTVLNEIDGPVGTDFANTADWFRANATKIYPTPAFDSAGNDRGERSIASVIDANYVDNPVSSNSTPVSNAISSQYSDTGLPKLGELDSADRLTIASGDKFLSLMVEGLL